MPAALQLVGADRTLAVSGSAGALRLPLTLKNASSQPALLAQVSVAEVRLDGKGPPLRVEPVPVQLSVAGQGVAQTEVKLKLDKATPPGRYEGLLKIGELTQAVVIEVVAEPKLQIRPADVIADVGVGLDQRVSASFTNGGNVPLVIHLDGPYPLAEEVLTPPSLPAGGSPGKVIFEKLLNIEGRPVLVAFGTVTLGMPGGPLRLEPGESKTAQVSVKLPENLTPQGRYHAFAPLYAEDFHLIVVTTTKPPAKSTKPADKGTVK